MAMITEHEQQVSDGPSVAHDQSPDSKKTVKYVLELLGQSKRFRERFDRFWHENYQFVVNGKQWAYQRPRWRFNEVVNKTWAAIMTEIAIQTDTRPKFEFLGQEISDEPFSEALGSVHDRNWEKYNWNRVIADVLFDCKLYHVAHAEVGWDEDLAAGLGDISFGALDPFYLYWDPQAESVNGPGVKARYLIYARPVPTGQLKLKYPDQADKIKPDVLNMSRKDEFGQVQLGKVYNTFDPYQVQRLPSQSGDDGQTYGGEAMTTLIRVWLRDDTLEEVVVENEDSTEEDKKREFVLKKKFPKGRYIEIANDRILKDGAPGTFVRGEWVEYESDLFPVARLVNYSYSREYAGENEVTHTKGPQKIINYIWSYILDSFRMQANPKQIITTDSGIDPMKLTNEPGLVIESNTAGGYRQEFGQAIAPGSFELLNTSSGLMDDVQGLQDASRGAVQTGIDSGILFEGFLEASQTRPRMKNRNLDQFLQECGQLMFDRYMQFYTMSRVNRITNEKGYPEFIEFYIPQSTPKGHKMAFVRRFTTIEDINGKPVLDSNGVPRTQDTLNSTVEVKGRPDIKVTSGSALPFAKAQKAQRALTFFNAGAIDREELLKVVDWPNREEVLRRLQEQEQAAAQAAAQQGQ